MLEFVPLRAWFRRDLEVRCDGSRVAVLARSPVGGKGSFDLEGASFSVAIEGWSGARASLVCAGRTVVDVERSSSSPFSYDFDVFEPLASAGAERWTLVAASRWSDRFRLTAPDGRTADLRRRSPFENGCRIDSPQDWPGPVVVLAAFLYLQALD